MPPNLLQVRWEAYLSVWQNGEVRSGLLLLCSSCTLPGNRMKGCLQCYWNPHPALPNCKLNPTTLTPVTLHDCPARSNPAAAYSYATILLPSLLLHKRYFKGEIRFGDISQASFAMRT